MIGGRPQGSRLRLISRGLGGTVASKVSRQRTALPIHALRSLNVPVSCKYGQRRSKPILSANVLIWFNLDLKSFRYIFISPISSSLFNPSLYPIPRSWHLYRLPYFTRLPTSFTYLDRLITLLHYPRFTISVFRFYRTQRYTQSFL